MSKTVRVTLELPIEAGRRLIEMHARGELEELPGVGRVLGLFETQDGTFPEALMRRLAALQDKGRAQAMMRASCSYSSPAFAIRTHGCVIDHATREVVWPDGERWPMRPMGEGR